MDASHDPLPAPTPALSPAFYPGLAYNTADLHPHPGVRCVTCCHWSLPLRLPARVLPQGGTVPMTYGEWLVYHWHLHLHQSGAPLLPA